MLLRFFFLLSFFAALHTAQAQCIAGDCVNGTGTYKYPSGSRYTGEFKNGEIHGKGICTYTDGSRYQGEWKHRYPDGNGTKTYADGTKRTGLWKKGKPVDKNGKVEEAFIAKKKEERNDDGTNIQTGCLSGDCKNGTGVFAYPDGSKYEGDFKNEKLEGQGTFFFVNGDKYTGNFKENYPDGQGTRQYADKHQETGLWKMGEFVGSILAVDGRMGCIDGDCVDGQGTFVFKEGSAKYTGDFEEGMPNGKGSCLYANGDQYIGEWEDGAFSGYGTLTLHDGTKIEGYWVEGDFHGVDDPDAEEDIAEVKTDTKPEVPAEKVPEKAEPVADFKESSTKVWAVVVGVSSYDHMPVLRYTDDDAYRFYAFLKGLEGGALPDEQVKVLIDEEATRENILSTLDDVLQQAGDQDLVIFYFSGHGLNGSFLPIDFDGYNNKLQHEELSERFNACKAKYKLVLADACHSGSIFAMRSGEAEPVLNTYYTSLSKSVSGTALIMSSKSDETSLESAGLRQGVFSHFLIRGLKGEADKNKNHIVTVKELFDFIYENVRAYTDKRQSPVLKGTYDPEMTIGVVRD